jgi:adenine-specific DNA-methyltransferase
VNPIAINAHTLIETRRRAIQKQNDSFRSSAERNRLGQFATPNALAVEIAAYVASSWGDTPGLIRFADPALGTGSFFSAALTAFDDARIANAIGVEIDPVFADSARDLWKGKGLEVICDDFTRIVASKLIPQSPNLVLANPPYVRHHHLDREEKIRLQALAKQMTGVEVNGLAGLYVYFLLLATAWMEDSGVAAWLVPSEFMDVNYGVSLKRYLTDRVTLIRVHRFDPNNVQFDDAFVSSAILVFRKIPPPRGHSVEFTFGGAFRTPQVRSLVSLDVLRKSRKWTVYPQNPKNDRQSIAETEGPMLRDFFRIQRGIATGRNKFFVLGLAEARRCGFPEQYLKPILPSPRRLKATEIEMGDRGYPLLDEPLCLIDCDLSEQTLEHRHPELWEYLQTAEALGIRDGYLVRKRSPWYRQEQRQPAMFLCTYMGRGSNEKRPFRFILNRSNAIATNLYLMLYPQGGIASMLRHHPDRVNEVFTLLGEITGNELRGEGRVYGGGLHKIEPAELGRISAVPIVKRWPELLKTIQKMKLLELFPTLNS